MPPSHPVDGRLDRSLLANWPLPADDGDKHDRGTVLIVGGTERTPGAALLAGTAALRIGAGRLQIATARDVATAMAIAMPEALVAPIDLTQSGPLVDLLAEADAVVVGPGLEDLEQTSTLLALTLDHTRDETVIVVDALAIAALPLNRSRVAARSRRLIITPNREELARISGERSRDEHSVLAVAQRFELTVVSFGHVAGPEGQTWFDPGVVTGLGTSGAGDVLAGAAAGAGARCHDAVQAACWATLCHRLAATRLSEAFAPVGYLARQLADEIAPALADLAR